MHPTGTQQLIFGFEFSEGFGSFDIIRNHGPDLRASKRYGLSSIKNRIRPCTLEGVTISQIVWYLPAWKNGFYQKWGEIAVSLIHFGSKLL